MNSTQIITGFLLAALIALAAWRAGALTFSGALAAAISGGVIFGLGGLQWALLLLAFFLSSSLLSKAFHQRKTGVSEKFAKGSQRDWGQVLANGGTGVLLVVAAALWPASTWPWLAFIGAMAAVNADTWATELGVLSSKPPRLITTGSQVEPGASGGVSALGSLAAAAGALFIGACAALLSLFQQEINPILTLLAALAGGIGGSFFDSLLGATVQAISYCPTCRKETERSPVHSCGTTTQPLRGLRWLNNDLVNFFCSLVGTLLALGVWSIW